jgi:hypothetical protein
LNAGPASRWGSFWKRLHAAVEGRPTAYRVGLFSVLLLLGLTLFPGWDGYKRAVYRVGTIQTRSVLAGFDFPIRKDSEVLTREQDEAAARVPPVLVSSDSVRASTLASFRDFTRVVADLRMGRYREETPPSRDDPAGRLSQRVVLAVLGSVSGPALLDQARARLDRYLSEGVVDSVTEVRIEGLERISLREPEGEWVGPPNRFYGPRRMRTEILADWSIPDGIDRSLLVELLLAYARPNVRPDDRATDVRRRLARDSVPTSIGMVLKGEKIIDAHERITPEHLRKLESYEFWRHQRVGHPVFGQIVRSWLGRLLLLGLALGGLFSYLAVYQTDVFRSRREITLVAVLFGFFLLLGGVMLNLLHWPSYLVPTSAAAVLFALVFEPRLGLAVAAFLVAAVGVAADLGLAFLIVQGAGVAGAVLSVRALRERKELYRFVLYVAAGHAVALVAVNFTQSDSWEALGRDALWALANPLFSAAFTLLTIPIVESLSGRCTDLTLLELQDLNKPIMKRLMLEAPGTYHHSLMVGTLAESAADAIGANPLLARVLAYYHDIGKLSKPDYFIENLSPGQRNPHDRLAATMSRLLLEAHVREGIQLARAEKLPVIIQRGIGEHHGRTLMRYFFHKARRQAPEVVEDDYRYPGPLPSFPESAVVLLADEVEATSRSLEDPTPSRIRGLIESIIQERAAEGELDASGLSLDDLARIRNSFVPILSALFHGRISYPGRSETPPPWSEGGRRPASEGSHRGEAPPAPPKEDLEGEEAGGA